jgi:hypothetical protein
MDTSFNYFNNDDNDDNVRAPDKEKVERLMEDTRSEYEKQIDEALYLSIQDFKQQEQIYKQYEDGIVNEHIKITNERKEQFRGFLFDLHKLIRLDKEIKEIYEIIEPIIEAYCAQYIKEYELDSITHEKIFKIIGNIRTNKNAIELLNKILIKNLNKNINKNLN